MVGALRGALSGTGLCPGGTLWGTPWHRALPRGGGQQGYCIEIIGFLNYGSINEENLIAEIQIDNKEKNKGITKKLLKRFYNLNKNKIKEVYAFINPNNNLSKEVFINHVGFKKLDGYKNRYVLTINDLKNYLEK